MTVTGFDGARCVYMLLYIEFMLSDIYFAPGLLQPVQREERGIPKIHLHSPQPNKWTNEYTRIHVQYIALPSHASMVLTACRNYVMNQF